MLDSNKVKLAIAPIGWTNDDMPDLGAENTFEQCISEMALAGFKGSEIGNKYPSDPDVLKKYLDIRGLQICNAWFSSYLTSKPYEETIEYNGSTYVYDKNKVAFAFIGVDRQEIGEQSDAYGTSGQADTDMIAVVDTSTGNVSIITIPRDTIVDIDLYSKSGIFLRTEPKQLCLAYAYGDGMEQSCTNVTSAVSRILMNVPIEKYFALDLDGIAPLNDAIGGVTLESLHDFPEKNIKKGETITIRGDFAEMYVRSRDLDYIEASLNRTQRQNQYVRAYADKLRTAVTNDFSVVTNLYNTARDYSQTNITLNDVTYIASLILSKGVGDFTSYTIDGEMKASQETVREDGVYAEFYADEDSVLDIVVNCFYTKVS